MLGRRRHTAPPVRRLFGPAGRLLWRMPHRQGAPPGPLRLSGPAARTPRACTGLTGQHPGKGRGAPCCLAAAARTPRPAGLPLPTRAAGRRACSARCARCASVARGSAPSAALFPDRRQAAAAFGGAPAGQPGPGAWLRARSLRRCSVAAGPRMRVGQLLPSACAPGSLARCASLPGACVAHPRPWLRPSRAGGFGGVGPG